jgi:hypothetical protein
MTTLFWVPRVQAEFDIPATPVVSNGVAYAAGDQVGGVITLTDIIRQDSNMGFGTSKLTDISIFCKSNNSSLYEILFFRNSPTMVNSDNGVFSITSANAVTAGFITRVSIGNAYTTSGASAGAGTNAFGADANLNVTLKKLNTETLPTTIFAVVKTTSTPTFTSTSDLILNFKGLID